MHQNIDLFDKLQLVDVNFQMVRNFRKNSFHINSGMFFLSIVAFCDFVQCENGRCVENKTSSDCFYCQCDAGFTGKLCETNIATCMTSPLSIDSVTLNFDIFLASGCNPPCQNGGQCQIAAGKPSVCVCPQDYSGSQCETSVLGNDF